MIIKTQIFAHRGASDKAPENTMAAFERARDVKAHGLELDVQMTKDGKLVVIHDESIDRTSNAKGLVENYTYDELRKFDFGSWKDKTFANESIPLLTDVINIIKDNNMLLNIEIKPALKSDEIEDKVIEICKSTDIIDQVIVSSFNHYCLHSIKKKCKAIETGILYQSGLMNVGAYAKHQVHADGIHPHKYAIVQECIKSAVKHGLKIRPWTIDNEKLFKKLAKVKYITSVITNRPEAIRKVLDDLNK